MGSGLRPALLVVDLIKAITDSNRRLGANPHAQIAATKALLQVAHEQGSRFSFRPFATTKPSWAMQASGNSS
jgi:hypothetical protein